MVEKMSQKRKKSLELQADSAREVLNHSSSLKKDYTDHPELCPPGVTSIDDSIVLPGPKHW